MKLKVFFLISLMLLVSATVFSDEKPVAPEAGPSPLASVVNSTYTFEKVLEGQEVLHDFIVKNEGDAVLKIDNVKAG